MEVDIHNMTEKQKRKSGTISRRDFLKDAGVLVGGAALGSTLLLAACAGETETETVTQTQTKTVTSTAPAETVTKTVTQTSGAETITVLTPTGDFDPVEAEQLAERPASLEGKKIFIVDISFSGSYDLAAAMGDWFARNRPDLDVEVTTEVGSYQVAQEDVTWSRIRDENGVAAICGGH
jgi:ABC-type glycerol-3-phosphate transport system substrate-binding protein